MPALVSLYIRNIIFGFLLAIAFVGALLALDVAGLRHLILASPMGWVALVMLVVFNGIVFSGVQFAIAVMRMADSGDGRPRGPRSPVTPIVTQTPGLVRVPSGTETKP